MTFEVDQSAMVIPFTDSDKFSKSATNEQWMLARLNFVYYSQTATEYRLGNVVVPIVKQAGITDIVVVVSNYKLPKQIQELEAAYASFLQYRFQLDAKRLVVDQAQRQL